MRYQNEIAPTIGGSYGAKANSNCLGGQRNIATLATACSCGGPRMKRLVRFFELVFTLRSVSSAIWVLDYESASSADDLNE